MNIQTRLLLNIPIFFGAVAGILLDHNDFFAGWATFLAAAIIQNYFFTSSQKESE